MCRRAAVVFLVGLVVAAACARHRPVPLDVERERLSQRQSEFLTALAAKDADIVAAFFSDDALLHIANMPPIEGRGAIRQFYGNLFGFLSSSNALPEMIQISDGGDMAYGTGRATNEFRGPHGPTEYTGKYLLIWRKLASDWMIVLYAVSNNQAEATRP